MEACEAASLGPGPGPDSFREARLTGSQPLYIWCKKVSQWCYWSEPQRRGLSLQCEVPLLLSISF